MKINFKAESTKMTDNHIYLPENYTKKIKRELKIKKLNNKFNFNTYHLLYGHHKIIKSLLNYNSDEHKILLSGSKSLYMLGLLKKLEYESDIDFVADIYLKPYIDLFLDIKTNDNKKNKIYPIEDDIILVNYIYRYNNIATNIDIFYDKNKIYKNRIIELYEFKLDDPVYTINKKIKMGREKDVVMINKISDKLGIISPKLKDDLFDLYL